MGGNLTLISVCIPTIRPEKSKRVRKIVWDEAQYGGIDIEILDEQDTERIGAPKMLKRLVDKSRGDLVMFLGDDTIPQKGFLGAALDAMQTLPDGWGVVGLNSQYSQHAAHFLADKRMLPLLGGEFFNTIYKHCWCDQELTDLAKEVGRYVFAAKAIVQHDHPIFTGMGEDADYLRVYSEEWKKHDKALYVKRKRDRLGDKLAIGFPLVNEMLRVNFFTSFSCMDKGAYTFLLPEFPHGPWAETLAEARNSLVQQAQFEGCRKLFMMDTDQIYPEDTLTKLLAHGKDVCGVRVHRRYPPFDPILVRKEKGSGKYYRVSDEEMFSGDLVEVDATGTGALLFNMEIFDSIEEPWFKVQTDASGHMGEDIYFCEKARIAGFRIFVDTSIEVDHLATIAINKPMYQMMQMLMKKEGGEK